MTGLPQNKAKALPVADEIFRVQKARVIVPLLIIAMPVVNVLDHSPVWLSLALTAMAIAIDVTVSLKVRQIKSRVPHLK